MSLVTLAGCSSSNIPLSTQFSTTTTSPPQARIFFDVNGTLYPDRWQDRISRSRVAKAGSLLSAASMQERRWIAAEENRKLGELASLMKGRKRIFIFVHGYNIDEDKADSAYDILMRRIVFKPTDVVIRVHWDGKLGTGIGMGIIWFPAAGYSQVVGVRGLRRILELPTNQEVHLISHSRGASVVLSALSDPPFSRGFRASTEALDFAGPPFLRRSRLGERGNRIHAVLLGPAVGYPDFWAPTCEPTLSQRKICSDPPEARPGEDKPCDEYRVFTPQLMSLRYTTNVGDRTLKKYALGLRRYFNATDLGYAARIGVRLAACFPFAMAGYSIKEPHRHAFALYARDPELTEMLHADGVEAQ